MTIMMPASDEVILGRRDAIVAALRAIVPGEGVIDQPAEMLDRKSTRLNSSHERRSRMPSSA